MKRESPKSYPVFLRLADESLHNAYYLLKDAMLLYSSESWSTATSLAILSIEELGKFFIIHHISMESVQFKEKIEREEFLSSIFGKGMVYKHRLKQEWALIDSGKEITKYLAPHYLDKLKQRGFYVGFENGKIKSPTAITQATALRLIKTAVEIFDGLRDFEFCGWLEGNATDLNHLKEMDDLISNYQSLNKNCKPVSGADSPR